MGGTMSGNMTGMSTIGLIWMLRAAAVVIALAVPLVGAATRA